MSLILEALRKSEAERQIGRAPGLLTPMQLPLQQRSGRRLVWVALAAMLLLIALAFAWWLGRSGLAVPVTDSGGGHVVAVAPRSDAGDANAPSPAPTVDLAPPQTPVPTAGASAAGAPKLPVAGPADLPNDPDFASTERESLPMPAPTSPPTLSAPPVASENNPLRDAVVPTAPPDASTTATAADAVAPPRPAEERVPSLRSLSEAERGGLPPLRLNMHVFNEVAERRFVLIDGRRLAEGDQIVEGVTLQSIRRDGALVEIRGRRVLIERP